MKKPETDTLLFLSDHPEAIPLYDYLEEIILSIFPLVNKRIQKTQISFSNHHTFACLSFAQVMSKAKLPDPFIVVTLGLPYPLESERVAAKTEPCPGRWTTHIVIGNIDEIDKELLTWIRQAYVFADSK